MVSFQLLNIMNNNQVLQYNRELSIQSDEGFEVDAASRFFPDDLYEILHTTHDYHADTKRYIRSSQEPGFQFEIRNSKVNFWVECKYCENKSDSDTMKVFKAGQLNMYKSIENSFLFLCTKQHGEQSNYLIPFNHISGDDLNFSFIEPYRLNYGLGVRPGMINKYLKLENTNPVIRF